MQFPARQRQLATSIALVLLIGEGHAAGSDVSEAGGRSPIAVTNCNDGGAGSLRSAIAAASSGDIVDLSQLSCSTISLTTGPLDIQTSGLGIAGPGSDRLVIDAGQRDRAISNAISPFDLTVRGVTIRNGKSAGDGGCIDVAGSLVLNDVVVEHCEAHASGRARGGGVHAAGSLTLDHARISGCSVHSDAASAYGGGAYAESGATVRFSTLSGNVARSATAPYQGSGGGLVAQGSSSFLGSTFESNVADFGGAVVLQQMSNSDEFTFSESTVSGNSATRTGGIVAKAAVTFHGTTIAFNCATGTHAGKYESGIGLNAPTGRVMTATDTLIADNVLCEGAGDDTPYDVGGFGGLLSGSHNLVRSAPAAFSLPADTLRDDPMLLPLADNGGPTRTHALAAGSRAIDAGDDAPGRSYDQRGDGAAVVGPMWDPAGNGPRDPRRLSWASRAVGAHSDIGAYELQSTGTTRTVTQCGDNGDGSVRSAVEAAASGDRIDLTALACATIFLKNPLTVTVGNLEIVGPGADRLAIRPDDPVHRPHRLITHTGAGTLSVTGLAFADGQDVQVGDTSAHGGCIESTSFVRGSNLLFQGCNANSSAGDCTGGAIHSAGAQFEATIFDVASCEGRRLGAGGAIDAAILSLTDTRVSQGATVGGVSRSRNPTGLGGEAGCIRSTARARLERTTLDGCASAYAAAGAFASLDLVNATVSDNVASVSFGGIYAEDAIVANSTIAANAHSGPADDLPDGLFTTRWARLDSTIVYGNGSGAQGDLGGGRVTGAHDLVGSSTLDLPPDTLHEDPRLGPLADNGGRVPTAAPATGGAAIDRGSNPLALASDARGEGFARQAGVAPDIGAYEAQGAGGDVIFESGFDP